MIVGLRPEHFVGAAADGEASALPVTVEITEQLGSETLVYFRIEGVVSSESSAADPQAGLGRCLRRAASVPDRTRGPGGEAAARSRRRPGPLLRPRRRRSLRPRPRDFGAAPRRPVEWPRGGTPAAPRPRPTTHANERWASTASRAPDNRLPCPRGPARLLAVRVYSLSRFGRNGLSGENLPGLSAEGPADDPFFVVTRLACGHRHETRGRPPRGLPQPLPRLRSPLPGRGLPTSHPSAGLSGQANPVRPLEVRDEAVPSFPFALVVSAFLLAVSVAHAKPDRTSRISTSSRCRTAPISSAAATRWSRSACRTTCRCTR